MKIIKIFIAIFLAMLVIAYIDTNRRQWAKVYQKINEWEFGKEELSTTLRIEYGLEFTDTFSNDRYLTGNEGLYLMGDVFVYPDQFSGNTYVINAKGDTIFKYIKKEKTTYLGIDSTEKNLYFHNE